MPEHIYKSTELTGSSSKSIEDAAAKAIARAAKTVRNLRWFEVTQIRGSLDKGTAVQWQVTLKIGFTLE